MCYIINIPPFEEFRLSAKLFRVINTHTVCNEKHSDVLTHLHKR